MVGTMAAAANAGGRTINGRAPMSSPSENNQTAVSATKASPEQSVLSEAGPNGKLCIALYKPKKFQSIWWPALRFPSVQDFQVAMNSSSLQKHGSARSLAWSSSSKEKKYTKKLVKKIMHESLSGNSIEVLCYLGRPLEDYITADDAIKRGVQISEYNGGQSLLTQGKDPDFPGLFLSENSESSFELFLDYFQGVNESLNRCMEQDHASPGGSQSDDSDSEDEESHASPKSQNGYWAREGQARWEAYHNRSHEEASPKPLLERQEAYEEEERSPQHHDEVSVAQSAAAISYTEASLMSASRGGGASVLTPPKYPEGFVSPQDDFDTIWDKHQMEGWDGYLDESTDEHVYEAPNGYRFLTKQSFCEFLVESYGTCGEPLAKKSRGRAPKRASETNYRASSRSRSRSRSREHSGVSWSNLWLYLNHTLGWSYCYATNKDAKTYGVNTTALWFRPNFDAKNRGELGADHFISEDSVVQYCQDHDIHPPSESPKPNHEEEDDEEPEDDSSTEEIHADDPGYATPDDQSTVPQDPGKPRLPSPESPSSGASGKSGGSYYSYDEPDRYVFQKLWARLRAKGWTWKKPQNSLDSYWYVKPASMRPQHEWKKGMDYFASEDELIAFCKERDDLSRKEREKRRRERMLRLKREREELEDTSEKKETKKRSRSKKETKDAKKSKKAKKDKQGDKNAKGAAKRKTEVTSKKQRKLKKKAKKKSKPEGWSCEDDTLKVDSENSRRSPWVRNMPRYEHKLLLNATTVTWSSSVYYLPGESRENCTQRLEKVESVAQHFALNPQSVVWASGETEPSNSDERDFQRSIRYALVPGLQSTWSEIRKITRSETSFLLRKLGYKNIRDTFWEPPEALVAMDHLSERYTSLESLCESLCHLSGDLHTPPSAGSRRRRQELLITPTQFMALRLRIAEGFSDAESDDELMDSDSDSESIAEEEERDTKKRKREPIQESDSEEEEEEEVEDDEQEYLTPPDDSNTEEEHQMQLTPSERRIKEFAEDEEQQMAMSPSRIKVGEFRKNPEDNTAPWAVSPPSVPSIGWSRMYYKMGITFSNGSYFLPGESSKNWTKKFSKVDDIRDHINEEGNFSKYLDKLDDEDRKVVTRHLSYANVPGNSHEWRKLRELSREETIIFLNLLGFEKGPRMNGWWQIPEGVPILEQKSYPTLSQLCKALVRLPDLEDRTMGMGNRRRSRKKEEDLVLSDYQMMALRLRIAEGFEEDEEIEMVTEVVEEDKMDCGDEIVQIEERNKQVEEKAKNDEESKPLFRYRSALIDQLNYDTSSAAFQPAWKALQDLGCYYTGRYHLPGDIASIDSNAGEMCQAILENSVGILDWENSSLDSSEIKELVRYLKALNFRIKDFSLVKEALAMTTKANIRTYLQKLGVEEHNGKYQIEGEECSEAEIVNIIRRTEELNHLSRSTSTPAKRRRSNDDEKLSELETICVRLWSVLIKIPLTNMPEKSTIGSALRKAQEMQSSDTADGNSDENDRDCGSNDDKSPASELEEDAAGATNQDPTEEKQNTEVPHESETTEHAKEGSDDIEVTTEVTTIDQHIEMEETNDIVRASPECNSIQTPSVPVRTAELNETPAERPAEETFETPLQMDTEEVAGTVDSYADQPKATEDAAAIEPLPVNNTATDTAAEFATMLMLANANATVNFQSPIKRRRTSRKENRQMETMAYLSQDPETTDADFHTPKQHNMGESSHGASRTASSHEEAFHDNSDGALMTQPAFGGEEHDADMAEALDELDFNMDDTLYSPGSEVATKQLSPTQATFAKRNVQHDNESVDILTQEECSNWLDRPLG